MLAGLGRDFGEQRGEEGRRLRMREVTPRSNGREWHGSKRCWIQQVDEMQTAVEGEERERG